LIPDFADVVTEILLDEDIIVRCGDGALNVTRKCGLPWFNQAIRSHGEAPKTIERLGLPGAGFDRLEHWNISRIHCDKRIPLTCVLLLVLNRVLEPPSW